MNPQSPNPDYLMTFLESLHNQLHQQGEMPFVDFMQQALYSPEYGYYSSNLPKLGGEGDFVTAPEMTALFGQTLANQCQEILTQLDHSVLFEFGAGSGRLCVDILNHLESRACLPDAYWILEVSSHLRHQQAETIRQNIPHLANRVRWLSRWPDQPFQGVMIANEVLDAMPVHRFMQTEQGILESYVGLSEQSLLQECFKPCVNERLLAHVKRIIPPDWAPYQSEVNLLIDGWIAQCATCLSRGALFIVDYGFPQYEYYHPERRTGTLMCHYRHQSHTNPLAHPGEEDITAHVDFTQVANAAHDHGFCIAGYCNQASFLLANGLLDLLSSLSDGREKNRHQQAVKQLLQPHEMGELFKVLALTKGLDFPLTGFSIQNKRATLA